MHPLRFVLAALVPALLLLAVGCDGDPPPPPMDAGPRRDSGVDAGALPMDAGPGVDGARPDSGAPRDGGPFPTCTFDPADTFELGSDTRAGTRQVGLAAGATRFAVVWNENRAGVPDLFGRTFSTAGLDAEVRLTDTTSRENPPTIMAIGNQWIAAWSDNETTAGFELKTQLLGADLASAGPRHTITDTRQQLEDQPNLRQTASGPMLAWVEDDMLALTREARTSRLNADGSPNGAVQNATATGSTVAGVYLAELGSGPALVWPERGAGSNEVWLQLLEESGARMGSPQPLTTSANSDGTADAALGVSGGAVVFGAVIAGVRNEVRFRALDGSGASIGSERILSPMGGTDASIDFFAGGYAVTYRDTSGTPTQIKLLLVSALGEVLAELPLVDAADGGGRTTVRVSGEGHIGVAWADENGTMLDIRGALVRCGS